MACRDCGKLIVGKPVDSSHRTASEQQGLAGSAPFMPSTTTVETALAAVHEWEAPDYFEPVLGWRSWDIDPDYRPGEVPILNSLNGTPWPPGEAMEAQCNRTRAHDGVPGRNCSCGLYSANNLAHLQSMHYHAYNEEHGRGLRVVGELNNWGKVFPGTQGWRAQFAYPKVIYVPFEAWELAEGLRTGYGVTVKLMNTLKPVKKEA